MTKPTNYLNIFLGQNLNPNHLISSRHNLLKTSLQNVIFIHQKKTLEPSLKIPFLCLEFLSQKCLFYTPKSFKLPTTLHILSKLKNQSKTTQEEEGSHGIRAIHFKFKKFPKTKLSILRFPLLLIHF